MMLHVRRIGAHIVYVYVYVYVDINDTSTRGRGRGKGKGYPHNVQYISRSVNLGIVPSTDKSIVHAARPASLCMNINVYVNVKESLPVKHYTSHREGHRPWA